MGSPTAPREENRIWVLGLSVALLAIAASIAGLGNQWAQDDMPLIWKNPAMHSLASIPDFFQQPYWPKPFSQDLYRPLALTTFALEWALGGGAPIVFRAVSYLLYAATALAVFALARRVLPTIPAWAAAAFFAVHPVHVEAVAVAVNQGELWVAILLILAVVHYIDARRAGGPLSTYSVLMICALYLTACLFKENALVLPGLLVSAEAFLITTPERLGARLARGRPLLLGLLLVAVSFYGVRTLVLSGSLVGSFTAEALADLTVAQRALTMLPVVTQWFRLLLWPAHLQADYSPQELTSQTTWGADQSLGAALVLGSVLVVFATWRRAPAIALGIAWCAIAIFPVHNIFVPTGILLAERTLLLPSVGMVLVLGGGGDWVLRHSTRRARAGLVAITGAVLVLGVYRSGLRHPVWSDQFNLWYVTATHDAPKSYRAHHALAEMYILARADGRAEGEYRQAIAMAPRREGQVVLDYANKLRAKGFCYPAVPLYRRALETRHNDMSSRASLIACLMRLGHYREARAESRLAISYGWKVETWQLLRNMADSALRVNAPPGSINVRMAGDSVGAYMAIGTSP